MRKRPTIPPRKCEMCGEVFTPNGYTQKYCPTCQVIATKETKMRYYRKMFPNTKPRTKCTEVCCICGAPFSSHFDGKPYCNTHYLRMYINGTPEKVGRKRTNTYDIQGDITVVTTSSGRTFTIDTADLEAVQKHSWCFSKTGYLVASIDHRVVKLHRYLLDPPADMCIDHINGDPTDNRRANMRLCTNTENARNAALCKNNKTGVTGVKKVKSGKYVASIMYNREEIRLGTFDTLEEAKDARLKAEQHYFKEFAPSLSRSPTIVTTHLGSAS